jgi:hypothetical protein
MGERLPALADHDAGRGHHARGAAGAAERIEPTVAEEALWSDRQDHEEEAERHHVAEALADIADGEGFQNAEQEPAHDSPGDAGEPAEQGRRETLEAERNAHLWIDILVIHRDHHAGDRREGRAEPKGELAQAVGRDAHLPGGVGVL